MDFKKWPKIKRFLDIEMIITQKLDGSNAQILFEDDGPSRDFVWCAGSRNKYILDFNKDNFGFAAWVKENSITLYEVLGPGRHYGEWCGPGIQTGEGLQERKFFSFNTSLEVPEEAKHLIEPVPLLYQGRFSIQAIRQALKDLNNNGSKVNGFLNVEGVVVNIGGTRYKVYSDNLDAMDIAFWGE